MNAFVRFSSERRRGRPDKQGGFSFRPPCVPTRLEKDVVILGMPNRFEIWSLARWQEEIGRFERKCTKTGLAREISASGSEAWRPLISRSLQETLEGLAPAPGGIFLDGRPGRRARGGDRRAIGPGVFWSAPTRTPRCSRLRAGALAFPWVRLVHADFADLDALRERREGRRSTVPCWISDLFLQLDDPSRASRSGGGSLDMRRIRTEADRRRGDPQGHREKELADLFYRFGEERSPGGSPARLSSAGRGADPNDHRACGTRSSAIPGGLATGHSPATRVFQRCGSP